MKIYTKKKTFAPKTHVNSLKQVAYSIPPNTIKITIFTSQLDYGKEHLKIYVPPDQDKK